MEQNLAFLGPLEKNCEHPPGDCAKGAVSGLQGTPPHGQGNPCPLCLKLGPTGGGGQVLKQFGAFLHHPLQGEILLFFVVRSLCGRRLGGGRPSSNLGRSTGGGRMTSRRCSTVAGLVDPPQVIATQCSKTDAATLCDTKRRLDRCNPACQVEALRY